MRYGLPTLFVAIALAGLSLVRCGSGISDRTSTGLSPLPISLWAVGDDGRIRHSSDGGASWIAQAKGATTESLTSVAFTDLSKGVIVGTGNTAMNTTDGGVSWSLPTVGGDTGTDLVDVAFQAGTDLVYAVGNGTTGIRITYSTNAGASWVGGSGAFTATCGIDVARAVHVYSGTAIGVVGSDADSAPCLTTNGGGAWTETDVIMTNAFDLSSPQPTHAWVVGGLGTIEHTTDGGTWTPQVSNTTQDLRAVSFVDLSHGWAAGANGTVVRTSDGGANWSVTTKPFNDGNAIVGIVFSSASVGFVLSHDGRVFRTEDGAESWQLSANFGDPGWNGLAVVAQ